jgi:hypothetical protein
MNSGMESRDGSVCAMIPLSHVQKTTQPIWTSLVQPGRAVLVYSQERISKKNADSVGVSRVWVGFGSACEKLVELAKEFWGYCFLVPGQHCHMLSVEPGRRGVAGNCLQGERGSI